MSELEQTLGRIARASERIASALESIARARLDSGPKPRLAVARPPNDSSGLGAVNLTTDGTLNAIIQNVGDAETTLLDPIAEIGNVRASGQIMQRGTQPQSVGDVPSAPSGPGIVVTFKFEAQAHLLKDLPVTLRLPHRPGRFPGVTVLEVKMAPIGDSGGRPGWRVDNSREVQQSDAEA